MIRALAAVAIFCGALLIFGGLASDAVADRLRVSALVERRIVAVIVTLREAEGVRWLSVYGCSAQIGETGAWCTGDFERESSFEVTGGRTQYLVAWRDLPRGTMQITAMAFDANQRVRATGQTVVFRGE